MLEKLRNYFQSLVTFYDSEMISSLINAMLSYTKNLTIHRITPNQVNYVMNQLKASGISLP